MRPARRSYVLLFLALVALSAPAAAQIAPTTRETSQGPDTSGPVTPPRLRHFVQAQYPDEALREGVDGAVVLQIAVDTNGHVTGVTVLEGVGHGLDEAAVAAARQFEFDPARRGELPVDSVLRYRYRFSAEVERTARRERERAELRGSVRGEGERPVDGATVTAARPDGTSQEALTGPDGAFRFDVSPATTVTVTVRAEGFEEFRATETPAAGESVVVTYRLTPRAQPSARPPAARPDEGPVAEAVVRTRRPAREVTRQTLEMEEIRRMPGTGGDALRAVQNFPGVARIVNGLLIVRGTTFQDTQIFLDGAYIPLVYHFFGLSSVVNTEILDRIDFYPGNFSARYGRVQGGIVDVGLRSPRTDHYHAVANVNLIDASAFVEGPITRNLSFAASVRRSYIDVVLNAALSSANVSLLTAPVYYDYQFLLEWRPSTRDRVRLLAFGSDDQLALLFEKPTDTAPRLTGAFSTHIGFHGVQLLWDHTFSRSLTSRAMASAAYNLFDIGAGEQFGIGLSYWNVTGRYELQWQASSHLRLNTGVDMLTGPYNLALNGIRAPTEGQMINLGNATRVAANADGYLYRPAAYVELELTPTRSLRLVPGVRVDYARDAGHGWTISPRLSFRWEFLHGWALKGGIGMFTQPPQPNESAPQENVFQPGRPLGNPDLRFQRSVHYDVGVERTFSEYVSLSVEGFCKTLDDQIVVQQDPQAPAYLNTGIGRIYGMEVLLRHRPSSRFFGWVAYTLSRSERRDAPTVDWRVFQFDQTHILTLIGSYRLGRGWEIGARFRYVTGNPLTPIVGSAFDGDRGTYRPIPGMPFSGRIDAFHQLDVRIDKTWTFSRWNLDLYLEVLNVYNRVNNEGVQYNYNYGQSQTIGGLPFFPNLGVRGEF